MREQVDILTNAIDGFIITDVSPVPTFVAQAFGVGVSEALYKGLQTDQGLCSGNGDPTPACQPTLSRADLVSLINNVTSAQKTGAQNLSSGLTSGAKIEYARRVTTSGTQSAAQIYFLGKGCLEGPNFGNFQVIGDEVGVGGVKTYGSTFNVSANSGTSDVINRLAAAGTTITTTVNGVADTSYTVPNYVFGIVSAENRSPTGTTGWRFIKLNNSAISDGTTTGLNKAQAIKGLYDFAVEAVAYKGPTAKTDSFEGTLIDAISANMAEVTPVGAETVGMFIIPENTGGYDNATYPLEVSKFQRGGSTPNSCQPFGTPF